MINNKIVGKISLTVTTQIPAKQATIKYELIKMKAS